MHLLQLSDRIAMPLASRRFGRDVPDISCLDISRRVERQTIPLKEGGYEQSMRNKAGTTAPVGPLGHGDSILGSVKLRVFGPAEQLLKSDVWLTVHRNSEWVRQTKTELDLHTTM